MGKRKVALARLWRRFNPGGEGPPGRLSIQSAIGCRLNFGAAADSMIGDRHVSGVRGDLWHVATRAAGT
jgi:hypothetical protein